MRLRILPLQENAQSHGGTQVVCQVDAPLLAIKHQRVLEVDEVGVAGCPAPEFRIFRTVEDGVFGIWIRAEPGGWRRNGWVQKSAPALVVPRPPPCPWPSKAQEVVVAVYGKRGGPQNHYAALALELRQLHLQSPRMHDVVGVHERDVRRVG